MPDEGMKWLPRSELLSYEELTRVARVCVERFGFESIRITGGEPTVRAHLPVLIRRLADLGVDLAMTIDAAIAAGLDPVKVNCVVVRGLNDDEILDFAAFGRAQGVELRFIEWMPLDGGGQWKMDQVVPATEIIAAIDAEWPLLAPDGG